jgi:integrase
MTEYPKPRSERGSLRFHRGAWRIAVRAGKHPNGKDRNVYKTHQAPNTAAGRKSAYPVLAAAIAEADALERKDSPESITVADLVERYIDHGIRRGGRDKTGMSVNTVRNYVWVLRHVVEPSTIGGIPVRKLTTGELDALYLATETKHGASIAAQLHSLMHAALVKARKWQYVETNVAADTDRPVHRARKVVPPSPEAVGEALDYLAETDPYTYAFVTLAATTGARRGSVVALKWENVDLDAGTVHFAHSIARGTVETARDGRTAGYTRKTLKVDNPYTCALDAETVAVLRRHRHWWLEHVVAVGAGVAEGWLFPSPKDPTHPVSVDAMSKRWYDMRKGHPELATVRLHDLRHYVATTMIDNGYSVVAVAKRLGNTPAVIHAVYAHPLDERDKAAADLLGARLRRTGTGE